MAIAREHDLPSWTALKEFVSAPSHALTQVRSFEPVSPQVCVIPAAGGLWSTAADLVCFGQGWAGGLPGGLARETLRPQADRDPDGAQMGLGWLLHQPKDLCGHAGGGPGAAASLVSRLSDGRTSVALANRLVPIEPVNARLVRPVD